MFDETPQSIFLPDTSPDATPDTPHTHAAHAPRSFDELLRAHGLRFFGGDLHNHTSYSDGADTPDHALRQMRARGLSFAAITDHGENLERELRERGFDGWQATAHHVRSANDESFVAVRGFEWSSDAQGHCNVLCSTDYTGWRSTGDESMRSFYAWLAHRASIDAGLVCGFNHPASVERPFDDYAPARGYADAGVLDDLFATAECFNRERDHAAGFFRLLDNGWHTGAAGGSDHHGSEWGAADLPRTGLLAPALTFEDLREALRLRRTFAAREANLRLALAADDQLMGARLAVGANATMRFAIYVDDPSARAANVVDAQLDDVRSSGDHRVRQAESLTSIELITDGGVRLARADCREATRGVWRYEVVPRIDGDESWFVARLMRGARAVAYSSPVWVRRRQR